MIFRKTKSLRFNMGHYEHVELYAIAEVDTLANADELQHHGVDPLDHDAVMDFIDDRLIDFLDKDVQMVSETTDKEESFVFPYTEYTTTK